MFDLIDGSHCAVLETGQILDIQWWGGHKTTLRDAFRFHSNKGSIGLMVACGNNSRVGPRGAEGSERGPAFFSATVPPPPPCWEPCLGLVPLF